MTSAATRLALSTANLYSFAQPANTQAATTFPAGSLYGLNNSNPFNPAFQPQGTGIGQVPGGIITFGGGVALYQNGQVIGGLGVSGDTACADHAIAYRMRHYAGLDTSGWRGPRAGPTTFLTTRPPPSIPVCSISHTAGKAT